MGRGAIGWVDSGMPNTAPSVAGLDADAYEGVRCVVTGGCGFIGAHLVDALVALGADVTVIDDLSSSDTEHLAQQIDRRPDRVRFVYASVLDPEALAEAVADRELCFHLAAIASVPASIDDPQRTHDVNATGTVRVAEACRRAGVKRIVNASTSAVYADDDGPKREEGVKDPSSPYGASKLGAETALVSHARNYPIDSVSLRLFNVFGPRQREGSAYAAVIPAFVSCLQRGEPCTIFGDGSATRDFVPVSEVVRAFLLAGVRREPFKGRAINVGSGVGTSVRTLFETLRELFARPGAQAVMEGPRPGDVAHSIADTQRAMHELGFACGVSLEEGLRALLVSKGVSPAGSPTVRD
ncbi:MAG: SDR family oxidoreductase [Phycisphaerales bacterium]